MAAPTPTRKKLPLIPIAICFIVAIGLVVALLYISGPVTKPADTGKASPEARAYVGNLALSDVRMQAAENFMKQRVVEILGKISNNGPRPLQSVDVYCLFYGTDGRELYRERLPIVRLKGAVLKPHETRSFRLPFDNLPDGWNQAMPKLVIAQITFAG
ncbi:MAG TPA: hypothetical protein VLI55_08415 [Bryobacteraceae bacterium]|nr:hypothetical protein [Bryobacteraceae bacterium]